MEEPIQIAIMHDFIGTAIHSKLVNSMRRNNIYIYIYIYILTTEPSMAEPFRLSMGTQTSGYCRAHHNQYQIIQGIQPTAGIKPRTVHLYHTSRHLP